MRGDLLRATWPDGTRLEIHATAPGAGWLRLECGARTDAEVVVDGLGVRLRRGDAPARVCADGFHSWDWSGVRDCSRPGEAWWSAIWGHRGRPATQLWLAPRPLGDAGVPALRWPGAAGELEVAWSGPPAQGSQSTGLPSRLRLGSGRGRPPLRPVLDLGTAATPPARPGAGRHGRGERLRGWMSWNCLGARVRSEDVLAAARLLPRGAVVLLDDGWERAWGDWEESPRFRARLSDLAATLRTSGHRLGVWVAPFAVDPDSGASRELADLLLLDAAGERVVDTRPDAGQWVLDAGRPIAAERLRALGRRLGEASVSVVKADFLYQAALPTGRIDDHPLRRLRAGLEALAGGFRSAAGPGAQLWACGAPGPLVADLVDACRSGGDAVVGVPSLHSTPPEGESFLYGELVVRAQERNLAARSWLWGGAPPCDVDAVTLGGVGATPAPEPALARRWLRLARRAGGPLLDSDLPDGSGLDAAARRLLAGLLDAAPPLPERPSDPLEMAPSDADDFLGWQEGLPRRWEPLPAPRTG